MRRLSEALLVAAFLTIISLPLASNLSGADGADAEAENRTLAAWPQLDGTWKAVWDFGNGMSTWFEDHFGFRARLIRWYGESRYFWFHVSPSPTVIRGKEGWLYYREDGGLEDYTNDDPLPPGEIANWRETILRARDWCRDRGIAYVFTIPPDKHIVYPEYFDQTIRQIEPRSRADQVIAALEDTGVVVDVRPALLAAKSSDRLYHVTDTHWNERGAFVAYHTLIDAIRQRVPAVPPPRPLSDFNLTTRRLPGRDLARMIGLSRVLGETDLRVQPKEPRHYTVLEPVGGYATDGAGRVVTEIPGSTLPRAVVFRDSFVSALAPFLSEHFSRVVYLWQNDFDAEVVTAEHPDVVIQEIVSRHLYDFIPTPWLIPDP